MKDLLLLHGALGDRTQLEPLKAALEGRFRCHVIEFEGHGSTPTPHPYKIDRFCDNVLVYTAEQSLERPCVFGYSMGGYVALSLAALPGQLESVATLGTKLAWTPAFAALETRKLNAGKIREKVPAFAELLERRHAKAGGWDIVLQRTAALMTELGSSPLIEDDVYRLITVPARLMVGDRDTVVSVDETARAAQALSHGQLVVLPDTPHPFEQVDVRLVADHLQEFFA